MKQQDVEKEVLIFFDKLNVGKVTLDTVINKEFNFIEEDTIFLLNDFQNQFGVDLSKFETGKYFDFNASFLFNLFKRKRSEKPALTVGHLAEVVRVGHWFEPS
jgi:hypothetical protein